MDRQIAAIAEEFLLPANPDIASIAAQPPSVWAPGDGTVLLHIGGKEFSGYREIRGRVITAYTLGPNGFPVQSSTKLGGSPPIVLARKPLREIVGAKQKPLS